MAILSSALSRAGGKPGMFLVNRAEIVNEIEAFKRITEQKIEDGIIRVTLKAQSLVQDKTPVEFGALKASIGEYPISVSKAGGAYRSEFGTNIEYAPYVEYGIKGRTYKYNVGGGTVTGVGAGMFRKTIDSQSDQNLLQNILLASLT